MEPAILSGILASLCTGLATMIGAMPVLGMSHMSSRRQLGLLAFAGGVMLAASVFSLILPGIAAAQAQGFSQMAAVLLVLCGALIGAVAMGLLGWVLPVPETVFDNQAESGSNARHYEPPAMAAKGSDTARSSAKAGAVWLLVVAITLHNIPEGAAVGMGFSSGDAVKGLSTAIAIGTQNLPEGLAVSCALAAAGLSRERAFLGGALSGAVEPIAGAAAAFLVTLVQSLLPWGLALAAGAMLLIVFGQIVPDIVRNSDAADLRVGQSRRLLSDPVSPASAFTCGLVLMCFLDIALG